jgi:CDP-diglyceride synthetase
MLKQRILTAILLAPIVLAIIIYGNQLIFTLFIGLLAFLIAFEWCQIVINNRINAVIISAAIAISIFFLHKAAFISIEPQRILIAASFIWLLCLIWLFKPQDGKNKFTIKYALAVGILLLFGASVTSIHQIPDGGIKLTLALFLLVWVADIGAFISGKSFGKHKLAPRVSPGKTIEGLLGGVILTAIYGYVVAIWLQQQWLYFVIAFPLFTLISVIGDLFASLLKRHGNIKDSGFLLPGHGGFLDRFDSLIAVSPFYYWFVYNYYVV